MWAVYMMCVYVWSCVYQVLCICGPVYMRYRSGEINYMYGYRYKCVYLYLFFNKLGLFV